MTHDVHLIGRVVIEISIAREQQYHQVHEAVSLDRLAPLLDRCLSASGCNGRIEQFTLDLGHLGAAGIDGLADSLDDRIADMLPKELQRAFRPDAGWDLVADDVALLTDAGMLHSFDASREATGDANSGVGARAYGGLGAGAEASVTASAATGVSRFSIADVLDVIEYFVLTGRMPWQNTGARAQPIADLVDQALVIAPAAMAGVLRHLPDRATAARRLVHHLNDDVLLRLFRCLASEIWATTDDPWLQTALTAVTFAPRAPESELREWYGCACLDAAILMPAGAADAYWHHVFSLVRDARDLQADISEPGVEAAEVSYTPVVAADAEEAIYIDDAGLCLLWPFIPGLFAKLGWLTVDGKEFVQPSARHRAISILRCLASGEREPPEYRLPFAKLLCGLDIDALHRPSAPVTGSEVAEASDMLVAVIGQAPDFGRISVDGLRGSFLLREGALAFRHGLWQLRVERRGYDILLDRLPWSVAWTHLPWMQTPIRVEWW